MGPDGANVIAKRVISTFPLGHSPYAPPRKELVTHQMAHTSFGLLCIDNPAPEQMSNIGGERIHLASISIESQREKLPLIDPEILVKAPLEFCCFVLQPLRQFRVAPERSCEASAAHLRIVDISLDLTDRKRATSKTPIGKED